LVNQIEAVLLEFSGYGYRRVTKELQRRGVVVNKKRVQKLMQNHHLQRRRKRRFLRTTDSSHSLPVYPNLVKGIVVERPNHVWVADITYVRLLRGFVYLAALVDLFSRKVVGWALSASLTAELAVEALRMALLSRKIEPGLIHHSDRGVQYASDHYVGVLQQHGIVISMSRKGNPYDNATMESFIKTLKVEEVYLNEYATEAEARENIGAFIETIYNIKRLHSSLGYCSPDEFETFYRLRNVA
jgi:transposase InsO family protein